MSGEESFERLVARWGGEVLNLAWRLTGNLEDAHDIRQMAFERAYRGLEGFDGRSRFSSWLFRIVVNLCRDHARKRRAMDRRDAAARALALAGGREGAAGDGRPEHEEMCRQVARAVGRLPAAQREVLVLRHYHQVPLAEIARITGVPPSTTRSRLSRALTRLREELVTTELRPTADQEC